MPLANVALTDTFDTWRTRTNQIIVLSDGNETRSIAAFDKANTAGTDAISAFGTANAAFGKANTANTDAIAAFTQANTAGTNAIAAFGKANTAGTDAGAAFGQANTARTHANSAFAAANAAFNAANTISLDPVYTGNIIATGPANTVVIKPSSSATVANTITIDQYGTVYHGNSAVSPFDTGLPDGYYETYENLIVMNSPTGIETGIVWTDEDRLTSYITSKKIDNNYRNLALGDFSGNTDIRINTYLFGGANALSQIILQAAGGSRPYALVAQNGKVSISRSTPPVYELDVGGSVNAAALLINGTPVSGAISLTTDDTTNDSYYITFSSANTGSVESINVANALYFNPSTGTLNSTDFNSTSDIKYKTNVETISNALNVVCQLRGVSFNWKETGKPSYGLIAQEVREVIPEVVNENINGSLSLNYDALIGYLVEAIKDINSKLEK